MGKIALWHRLVRLEEAAEAIAREVVVIRGGLLRRGRRRVRRRARSASAGDRPVSDPGASEGAHTAALKRGGERP
jgi:hypothetical protein